MGNTPWILLLVNIYYLFPILILLILFLIFLVPDLNIYYKLLFLLNSKVNPLSLSKIIDLLSFSNISQFHHTLLLNGILLFFGVLISVKNVVSRKNSLFSFLSILFLVYSALWLFSLSKSMHSAMFAVLLAPLLISHFIRENNLSKLLNKKVIILLIILLLSRNLILMFYDPPMPYTESVEFIHSKPLGTVFYDESSSNLFRSDACYLWFGTFNEVGGIALDLLEKDDCEIQVKENPPEYMILKDGTRSEEFLSFVYDNYVNVKSVKDLDFFEIKE